MKRSEIYFDNNATTRPLPDVREEVLSVIGEEFGNPSSAHSTGERAREHMREARASLAKLLGCSAKDLTFTGSGTESNNMAFYSCTRDKTKKPRIVTTSVEHSSIQKMCSYLCINGVDIKIVNVDSEGLIDIEELKRAVTEETSLVSVQWVNNETGVVQPIEEIGALCSELGVPFHTDAAQAVGKMSIELNSLPFDFLSLTGHKFHSPMGIGAIYCKDRFMLAPILFGGFQEEGFRPGTENLPGIAGMGKAAELRYAKLGEYVASMTDLRDRFEEMVLDSIPGTKVNGTKEHRVCNTSNLLFSGIDGRKLVKELDNRGVRCSQSSACTNFEIAPSYVLCAMGLTDEEAYSSIRFSFSVENTYEEIDVVIGLLRELSEKTRI